MMSVNLTMEHSMRAAKVAIYLRQIQHSRKCGGNCDDDEPHKTLCLQTVSILRYDLI